MDISLVFVRMLFLGLCVLISTTYATASVDNPSIQSIAMGFGAGMAFGAALIGFDSLLRRFTLKTFNVAALGLFFGYMMGQALSTILVGAIDFRAIANGEQVETLLKAGIFLSTIYFGMMITARSADQLHVSIPFVKLTSTALKKKDILIDASILQDPRIIDLASSGLLDHHLVVPRYIVNELQQFLENSDEMLSNRAKRMLEVLKKLETIPHLDMRYCDSDFSDVKDPLDRITKIAKFIDANVLTAEMSQIQQSPNEDVRIIKFQYLCNALKPLTQNGENINIKIQRYGKEPRQGVGYLDDGTMVVVNGGAEYIGETIKAQVLSVKHTSSGRMIFCNAVDDEFMADREYNIATQANSQVSAMACP